MHFAVRDTHIQYLGTKGTMMMMCTFSLCLTQKKEGTEGVQLVYQGVPWAHGHLKWILSEPQSPHLYSGANDASSSKLSSFGSNNLQAEQLTWHIVGARVEPIQPSVGASCENRLRPDLGAGVTHCAY